MIRKKKHTSTTWLDKAVYGAIILSAVMTAEQARVIFVYKTADGVSLISWATYAAMSAVWIVYALRHKDIPLLLSNVSWLVFAIAICIGAVLYS